MNSLFYKWIKKAEGDWNTANREIRARKNPNYESACFHSQQCAEKYLKAFLQFNESGSPSIVDLVDLMKFCSDYNSSFKSYYDVLLNLNQYELDQWDDPYKKPDRKEAQKAVNSVKVFRDFVRKELDLDKLIKS